jgi:tagatose 1,6-diphosphate aldolase
MNQFLPAIGDRKSAISWFLWLESLPEHEDELRQGESSLSGKQQNLTKLSDRRGIICALAVDHRGPLRSALARARGVSDDQIRPEELAEFKAAVARALAPSSSAVLLDPEYSRPAIETVRQVTGLLLAYEQSGYDHTRPGRLPALLPMWSVRRLVDAGAQGIKVLLHYTPHEAESYNRQKQALVERVGAECVAAKVPFFLELLSYTPEGRLNHGGPRDKPELVRRSIEEFGQDRYSADILKVEVPVDVRRVDSARSFRGDALWTRTEAKDAFQLAFSTARRPFIFLSAGVSNDEFAESLELASESGVPWSGVLCGRALWQDGIPVYTARGLSALEEWLASEGRQRLAALQRCLQQASPWHGALDPGSASVSPAG